MTEDLSQREQVLRDTALWMPYGAFIDCSLVNDAPSFAIGSDESGIIPDGWPYPSSGYILGLIDGELEIIKASDLKDEDPFDLATLTAKRFFAGSKRVVQFNLLASRKKIVTDLFDDPGPRSEIDSYFGGEVDAPEHSLVLMFHDAYHEGQFLCIIHWNVTAIPANEKFGGQKPSTVQAAFRCYAGFDPNDPTCLRSPGTQLGRKLYLDDSGSPVNPDSPDTLMDNNASNKAYPALTMSNML